ncbi:ribonuclease H1 domain-containing protein [Alkaliflexus imshenetskii]|jgi:ribonuclease HI|uniref:ribonuclease H1 domain-containing protein n=1 Tax=Alkaliflexus imshenetskii TaxID=286730 RepID=UPI00047B0394|nr:ribonuclease H family protein [Alkaliflexus imshenetskii]
MSTAKYYVVWKGRKPGIYNNWNDCKEQITGFEEARYKSFKTLAEAEMAFKSGKMLQPRSKSAYASTPSAGGQPIRNSLSVDAACSGNPGAMEYRGVHVETGEEWFLMKFQLGTNNIGEFLAIVHGLAELKRRNINIPVYTDSQTALSWIRKKKCGTKLALDAKTQELFGLVRRAEKWLSENNWVQPLLKWDTERWGEIPADFGRK